MQCCLPLSYYRMHSFINFEQRQRSAFYVPGSVFYVLCLKGLNVWTGIYLILLIKQIVLAVECF